ncbi:hypothetical protein [Odoribacter sp. Z80]|uniref:hypothetical protein n=1 Tax=Odoribacter sp. Z80 TaxID=2304575 RepID=UPI00137B4051|nr:hypothetical protein [Odoribacter sp. Z80]NCE72114.1 hypothetical protein [Odoribacter sp. Z80]
MTIRKISGKKETRSRALRYYSGLSGTLPFARHPLGSGSYRDIRRGLSCIAADVERYWCGTPAVATGGVPKVYRRSTAPIPEEYRTYRGQSPAEPYVGIPGKFQA